MRPLHISAVGEFESALHAFQVAKNGFKTPASTHTGSVADHCSHRGWGREAATEALCQQGDKCPGGQELTHIDYCLFHPDPGDSSSSPRHAPEEVSTNTSAGKHHRLGFWGHPHLDELRIHLEAMQSKRCLPADCRLGATEQQRRPGSLLERLEERGRVVQPLRRSHHVTLSNQTLKRLVADSDQAGLLDREEPLLRPYQLPEFPREILSFLHSQMLGNPVGIASARDVPVDNASRHRPLPPKPHKL